MWLTRVHSTDQTIEGRPVTGITTIRKLSEREVETYERGVRHLLEFYSSLMLIPLIDENLSEFDRCIQSCMTQPLERLRDPLARRALTADLNRLLANFLTSCRLFLDHTQARTIRRYGPNSRPVVAFVQATKSAFDASSAYRIMYKMRDYLQHVGLPIHTIGLTETFDPALSRTDYSVGLTVDPHALLRHHAKWGKATADLQAIVRNVPVAEYSATFASHLRTIEHLVLDAERDLVRDIGKQVLDIVSDGIQGESLPTVIVSPLHDPAMKSIRFMDPPWAVLEIIGIVRFQPPSDH